jgi:hypothetical protein
MTVVLVSGEPQAPQRNLCDTTCRCGRRNDTRVTMVSPRTAVADDGEWGSNDGTLGEGGRDGHSCRAHGWPSSPAPTLMPFPNLLLLTKLGSGTGTIILSLLSLYRAAMSPSCRRQGTLRQTDLARLTGPE